MAAAFTVVGAYITIPFPYLPVTLQAAAACLAGIWLGPVRGATSQGLYLLLGLLGLPVFAGGGGGVQYVISPTFGYLLGFMAAAFVAGLLARGNISYLRCLLAVYAGMVPLYLLGMAYFLLVAYFVAGPHASIEAVLAINALPALKDSILALLTAYIALQVKKHLSL